MARANTSTLGRMATNNSVSGMPLDELPPAPHQCRDYMLAKFPRQTLPAETPAQKPLERLHTDL